MSSGARVCTFCVMDDSGPPLVFDESGECNGCRDARARRADEWITGAEGRQRFDGLVREIKDAGRGKRYDAIVGLSGGVDSSYLAHFLATTYDLRLLAVHVDGGWNSEPAVRNIELLVRNLDLDLFTYVVEWEEMRDLQLAFLRASVLNQDLPQDHAFFSTLYRTARNFDVSYFLSGVNFSGEAIHLPNWGHPNLDGRHVRAVHKRFGSCPLRTFPIMDVWEYLWLTGLRATLKVARPLNFLDYDKIAAKEELTRVYGFRDYGAKHQESRFTKFYQEVYLPARFGFDKRRLHLSSQIVAGQITRDQALEELRAPITTPDAERHDVAFVAKKLGVDVAELRRLIAAPPADHGDYPGALPVIRAGVAVKSALRRLGRLARRSRGGVLTQV